MAAINIFAPAKINLFLHITGRRPDGYHLLDSMVVFADIGDEIAIEDATSFSLTVDGPFGKDLDPTHQNSITAAVHLIAKFAQHSPQLRVKLTKNLPVASGIGGGSSNAAATLLACQRLWQLPHLPTTEEIVTTLGADVPVCLRRRPTHMKGIGDILSDVGNVPAVDVVLINPGTALPTARVFKSYDGAFSPPLADLPAAGWGNSDELTHLIQTTRNDLEKPAIALIPTIRDVLENLSAQPGCRVARMSGSGATCFGIFPTPAEAKQAALDIAQAHATWWVKAGRLLALGSPDPVSVN
jgi:4-diphosphocytidyl-2-C-methyl-D-erythritol kinase